MTTQTPSFIPSAHVPSAFPALPSDRIVITPVPSIESVCVTINCADRIMALPISDRSALDLAGILIRAVEHGLDSKDGAFDLLARTIAHPAFDQEERHRALIACAAVVEFFLAFVDERKAQARMMVVPVAGPEWSAASRAFTDAMSATTAKAAALVGPEKAKTHGLVK